MKRLILIAGGWATVAAGAYVVNAGVHHRSASPRHALPDAGTADDEIATKIDEVVAKRRERLRSCGTLVLRDARNSSRSDAKDSGATKRVTVDVTFTVSRTFDEANVVAAGGPPTRVDLTPTSISVSSGGVMPSPDTSACLLRELAHITVESAHADVGPRVQYPMCFSPIKSPT